MIELTSKFLIDMSVILQLYYLVDAHHTLAHYEVVHNAIVV